MRAQAGGHHQADKAFAAVAGSLSPAGALHWQSDPGRTSAAGAI